jgi:hypothetical protein
MPTRLGLIAGAAVVVLLLPLASAAAAGIGAPVTGLHPGKKSFFALPPEEGFSDLLVVPRPSCKAGQIDAAAFTESSPDGVLGVVELRGTKFHHVKHFGKLRCKLPIGKGPRTLLAPDGSTLDVPRGRADKINPAYDAQYLSDLGNGKASWGFGWFGSYCGDAPRYLVMKLKGDRGTLNVPYDGPTPPCPVDPVGPVSSTLTDGPATGPHLPAQPAPPSYLNLTTSAQFLGTTNHKRPAKVEVTISDTATDPVELMPCPLYQVTTKDTDGDSSITFEGSSPGCKHTDLIVRPGQPVTFRVSREELSPGNIFGAPKGSTFKAHIELAGMPTAKASTTVE